MVIRSIAAAIVLALAAAAVAAGAGGAYPGTYKAHGKGLAATIEKRCQKTSSSAL